MALYSVVEPVTPIVTHRGNNVIPPYIVPEDLEHRAPPVALQPVADPDGQPQQAGTGVRRRQPLGSVAFREGDEVCDLLPFKINDLHQLAGLRAEGRAMAGRNVDLLQDACAGSSAHGQDCASYTILGQDRRLLIVVPAAIGPRPGVIVSSNRGSAPSWGRVSQGMRRGPRRPRRSYRRALWPRFRTPAGPRARHR